MTSPAQPPPADASAFILEHELPSELPADPMPIVAGWLEHATRQRVQPNPNAMTLATVDPDGRPSARIVLCKDLDAERGAVTFYTNKQSRKAQALSANARAALILHWDTLDRQVRIEGPVTAAPDEASDAYFASRHPASRLGAWASDQSKPIASREDLLAKVIDSARGLGLDLDDLGNAEIPRPPHWGGYDVWAETVELWLGSPVRMHDRARWTRALTPAGANGFDAGSWTSTRLQP